MMHILKCLLLNLLLDFNYLSPFGVSRFFTPAETQSVHPVAILLPLCFALQRDLHLHRLNSTFTLNQLLVGWNGNLRPNIAQSKPSLFTANRPCHCRGSLVQTLHFVKCSIKTKSKSGYQDSFACITIIECLWFMSIEIIRKCERWKCALKSIPATSE